MAEVTSKVTKIYQQETVGTDKQKQVFVVETQDQYPKKIALEAWSKTLDYLAKVKVGDTVKVSFDVSSREYNDKWYTSAKAFKIEVVGAAQAAPQQEWVTPAEQNLPF